MLMFFMSLFRQKGGRVDALLPGCPTILSEYIFITIFRLLWPFTDYYPSLIFFYWGEYSVWPLALFNQHHLKDRYSRWCCFNSLCLPVNTR